MSTDEGHDAMQQRSEVVDLQAEVSGLRAAMATRAIIEQAKGLIIASMGVDAEQAFELLIRQSQAENVKLHVVAERLISSAIRTPTARR